MDSLSLRKMRPLVVALVNAADFALLDVTHHAQVVPVTAVVDARLALAVALITVRIHVQAAVQVAAMAIAMAVPAAKDVVITVKQTVVAAVKNAVMLTALVIVVDLVDLPALRYVEIAKILVIIHALAIVDQNVQIAVTLTVLDHAQVVVQAVATPTALADVRAAQDLVKELVQATVKDALVNSSCNRPYGMRCYK